MKIESAAKRILNSKRFCRPMFLRAAKSLCHQERGPRFLFSLVDFFHMFLGSCRSHMFTMLTRTMLQKLLWNLHNGHNEHNEHGHNGHNALQLALRTPSSPMGPHGSAWVPMSVPNAGAVSGVQDPLRRGRAWDATGRHGMSWDATCWDVLR